MASLVGVSVSVSSVENYYTTCMCVIDVAIMVFCSSFQFYFCKHNKSSNIEVGNENICASNQSKRAREGEGEGEKSAHIKMSKMNVKCGKVLCAQTKENQTTMNK